MINLDDKKKKLIQYAEKTFLNDFPGFNYIVTLDSKYIRVNDISLKLIGYKSHDQVFETTYANMPCQACENAEYFEQEDKAALNHEIQILSYNNYQDNWKILLGQKNFFITMKSRLAS